MNDIVSIYSKSQQGGELPYFIGKQYGTGWLKTIGRYAFPILKGIGSALFGTAKDVVMKNKPIMSSLKSNVMDVASNVIPEVESLMSPPKKQKTTINKLGKSKGTIFNK